MCMVKTPEADSVKRLALAPSVADNIMPQVECLATYVGGKRWHRGVIVVVRSLFTR